MWTDHFLPREKLNAVCDTHASRSKQNLSVWEYRTVHLVQGLSLVLDM